jgi:hypothetical protein
MFFVSAPDSPHSNKGAACEVFENFSKFDVIFRCALWILKSGRWFIPLLYFVWKMIGCSPICGSHSCIVPCSSIRGINVSPRHERPRRGKKATAQF